MVMVFDEPAAVAGDAETLDQTGEEPGLESLALSPVELVVAVPVHLAQPPERAVVVLAPRRTAPPAVSRCGEGGAW